MNSGDNFDHGIYLQLLSGNIRMQTCLCYFNYVKYTKSDQKEISLNINWLFLSSGISGYCLFPPFFSFQTFHSEFILILKSRKKTISAMYNTTTSQKTPFLKCVKFHLRQLTLHMYSINVHITERVTVLLVCLIHKQ